MYFLYLIFLFLAVIAFCIFIYLVFDNVNPVTPVKIKWNNNIVIISLLLLSISSLFLGFSIYYTNHLLIDVANIKTDYSKLGAFGDFIGGMLNPAVAFIGIIAASLAFYAQYRANSQVQRQFRIQQFESQFYEMIRLHKANVSEMKISGYDVSIQESIQTDKDGNPLAIKTIVKSQIIKFTEARKVFVTMHTELIAIYEFLEYYNIIYEKKIKKEELLKLAYEIFFFGVKSEVPSSYNIDEEAILIFKRHLTNIKSRHKDSNGEKNIFPRSNMKDVELYIKYSPFSGHESRLGHYYRHLYSTVKFVVEAERTLFSYKEVRGYLKILRSQMSNDEQLMLYYNCTIGFGMDWVTNGFLTKYRMIHNLPIDNVKYAPNPREYFAEYISTLVKEDGSLFEWGDKSKE